MPTPVGDHYELKIIWGVEKTPGDTASAELGVIVLDLADPAGFCVLAEGGFSPQRPSIKNGGAWLDSSLVPGRYPIVVSDTDVTETLRLTIAPGSFLTLNNLMRQLDWFVAQASAFYIDFNQIQPVYLKHQIVGEPGPRYALIRTIEYAVDDPDDLAQPVRDITMTIEREAYWRGLAPGDNPKKWSYYTRDGNMRNFNVNVADLGRGSDALVQKTLNNRTELNPTTLNVTVTNNYVDIPANLIPGDAPALAFVDLTGDNAPYILMCGRSTKPTTVVNRANAGSGRADLQQSFRIPIAQFNAGDAGMGTDTTRQTSATSGAGNLSNNTLGTRYFSRTSFATATDQIRLNFAGDYYAADIHILRGEYVAFIRGRQNAGAFGNISMYLEVSYAAVRQTIRLQSTNPTVSAGAATDWYLSYMGILSIPLSDDRTTVGMEGYGIDVDNTVQSIAIALRASRASGVATLDVLDLILIPKDEVCFIATNDSGLGNSDIISDTTGYLSRGRPQYACYLVDKDGATAYDSAPYPTNTQGSPVTLLPQVNNRLYFVGMEDPADNYRSRPDFTYTVRVNIIPRWSGLRDV
jgi:hypothetical protein